MNKIILLFIFFISIISCNPNSKNERIKKNHNYVDSSEYSKDTSNMDYFVKNIDLVDLQNLRFWSITKREPSVYHVIKFSYQTCEVFKYNSLNNTICFNQTHWENYDEDILLKSNFECFSQIDVAINSFEKINAEALLNDQDHSVLELQNGRIYYLLYDSTFVLDTVLYKFKLNKINDILYEVVH